MDYKPTPVWKKRKSGLRTQPIWKSPIVLTGLVFTLIVMGVVFWALSHQNPTNNVAVALEEAKTKTVVIPLPPIQEQAKNKP